MFTKHPGDSQLLYNAGEIILAVTILQPNYNKFKKILVELQDITWFQTAEELASYLGITPSQYSSGERIRMGHITHAGNARLRTTHRMTVCKFLKSYQNFVDRVRHPLFKTSKLQKNILILH
jgi:transposase